MPVIIQHFFRSWGNEIKIQGSSIGLFLPPSALWFRWYEEESVHNEYIDTLRKGNKQR